MRVDRRRARHGFTLVELVVAIAVTGVLMITVRAMYDAVTGAGVAVTAATLSRDRQRNAERELRSLVARATIPRGSADEFAGDPISATFTTRCATAFGWQVPCRVGIEVQLHGDTSKLTVRDNDMEDVAALIRHGPMRLQYLAPSETRDSWVHVWRSTTIPPVAIAAIGERDTVYLRVGERG